MANFEFVRNFAVLPKEIFVFFVPQRMALWYGAEMNSYFEVQGGAPDFAVGQKVRITGRLAEREVTLTTVVTAYQWERLFEWQFQDSYGVRGKQRWEIQQMGSGDEANDARPLRDAGTPGQNHRSNFHSLRSCRARPFLA